MQQRNLNSKQHKENKRYLFKNKLRHFIRIADLSSNFMFSGLLYRLPVYGLCLLKIQYSFYKFRV